MKVTFDDESPQGREVVASIEGQELVLEVRDVDGETLSYVTIKWPDFNRAMQFLTAHHNGDPIEGDDPEGEVH